MRNVTLTPQQRKEILELYKDSSVGVKEIGETYSINSSTVCRIAKEEGAVRRNSKIGESRVGKPRRTTPTVKTCGTCKKKVELVGAKFCPYCGTDIRSPKEMLIQRLIAFAPKVRYLPENCRDELQNLLIDVKNELAKEA